MCKNYISANKYFINPFILTSIITMDHLIENLKKNSITMC